jgi:hypothetical protein
MEEYVADNTKAGGGPIELARSVGPSLLTWVVS